jgi:hypothetical protein
MFESRHYWLGVRRMGLSRWVEGGNPEHVAVLKRDKRLVGYRKIPAGQWAKLPRYWREGAVEVRPFPAETRPRVSVAQGLSGEAMKGNPTTTVIPGVDGSKSTTTEELTEPKRLFRPPLLKILE